MDSIALLVLKTRWATRPLPPRGKGSLAGASRRCFRPSPHQDVPVALAHRLVARVEVLEQRLSVLAARPEGVAELGDRD